MKKLTLLEIKAVELEILAWFDNLCKNNNLNYCLSGGTLLGAVRHQGFIPWDDDIDLMMPRQEYDKVLEISNTIAEGSRYQIISFKDKTSPFPYLKIVDTHSLLEIKDRIQDAELMLFIDVFPVDGLPVKTNEVERWYRIARILQHFLSISIYRAWHDNSIPKRIIKVLMSRPVKLVSPYKWAEMLDSHCRKYPFENSENVGVVCWGYGKKECMPGKTWKQYEKVEFEGSSYNAPGCWDYYLRSLYGNYMELPPVEQRKTHNLTAYVKDE